MRKRWATQRSGGSRIIGQSANIRELADNENVRIDFYIDRKAGNIAFYVDGRQAQVWADQDPEDGNFEQDGDEQGEGEDAKRAGHGASERSGEERPVMVRARGGQSKRPAGGRSQD